MNNSNFCILVLIYAILVVTLLDSDGVGASSKKPKNKQTTPSPSAKNCPKDTVHMEQFKMKMALCRPNISVICTSKPNNPCFKNRTKLKATAFVHRRNGQCLIESNVSSHRTIRFHVEAKRVINPNAEGSRTISGGQKHERGKCLLKYICQKRFIRSITMECGAVMTDENATLTNVTRQRKFWVAPPKYKDYVYFTSEMAISSDKRVLNISSAKIYIPGMEQQELNANEIKDGDPTNAGDKT